MRIKKLINFRKKAYDFLEDKANETKNRYMESVFGEEYEDAMESILPFDMGGSLGLYYYPNYCDGTVIVTKELTDHRFCFPCNNTYSAYELAMITKYKIDLDAVLRQGILPKNTFEYDHEYIESFFYILGNYVTNKTLNPYDTVSVPIGRGIASERHLIADALSTPFSNKETRYNKLGIMLFIEIHYDEMQYANELKENGKILIHKLKEKGFYPYTGINRPSVLNI